jgi:hypothetical protein
MVDAIDVGDGGPLEGLSDEQISTLSEDELERLIADIDTSDGNTPTEDSPEPDTDQDGDESGATGEEEDTGIVEAGGAADSFQSLDPHADTPDTTTVDRSETDGDGEGTDDDPEQSSEDGQSSEAAGESDDGPDPTDQTDWKAAYEKLMSPFKASGRVVKVESPEDAVRLMQMGYDYTEKMRQMKPHQKALKTLEANGLLEPEKINFAIDLLKGNPEAVKKFLKDQSIDPIDIDLEDGAEYDGPTDHTVSDQQLALDEVLDSIRSTEQFPRTAQVITKEWDTASQNVLMDAPALIAIINDHMGRGYFDQIATKVQYERSMGRLQGLSDLDAYKTVGDAMNAAGEFNSSESNVNTPAGRPAPGTQQDLKGSGGRKARKRAASPTKGKASAGNAQTSKNFLSDFTDEEMESM